MAGQAAKDLPSVHLYGELEVESERGIASGEVHTDPCGEAETSDRDRDDRGDRTAEHVRGRRGSIVGRCELVEDRRSQDEVGRDLFAGTRDEHERGAHRSEAGCCADLSQVAPAVLDRHDDRKTMCDPWRECRTRLESDRVADRGGNEHAGCGVYLLGQSRERNEQRGDTEDEKSKSIHGYLP